MLRILLAIWVFMRWCEDLLWDHSEFAHKSHLCSSLNARTKARLDAAGFDEINTWLHEEPTQFLSMDELARELGLPAGEWRPPTLQAGGHSRAAIPRWCGGYAPTSNPVTAAGMALG